MLISSNQVHKPRVVAQQPTPAEDSVLSQSDCFQASQEPHGVDWSGVFKSGLVGASTLALPTAIGVGSLLQENPLLSLGLAAGGSFCLGVGASVALLAQEPVFSQERKDTHRLTNVPVYTRPNSVDLVMTGIETKLMPTPEHQKNLDTASEAIVAGGLFSVALGQIGRMGGLPAVAALAGIGFVAGSAYKYFQKPPTLDAK